MNPVAITVLLVASWYGPNYEGNRTASGIIFRSDALTCASWDYPMGTILRVECPETRKAVEVLCIDRGPRRGLKSTLDLSRGAFERLAPLTQGIIQVRVSIIHQ